jgi:cytochrome c1
MRWDAASSILLIVLAGCTSSKEKASPSREAPAGQATPTSEAVVNAPAQDALTKTLLTRFECNRCHEGTGLEAPPFDKQCVGCHQAILDGSMDAEPATLAKWSANLHSLPVAPSLAAVGLKLRREWVRDQLRDPIDMRPALEASMPRFRITAAEADALATGLVAQEAPPVTFPDLALSRGAALFADLSCNACHAFGAERAMPRELGAGLGEPTKQALLLAPDLAFTRERFQSGKLVAWLMNPQALQPDTLMPNFKLTETQASSLAAYLWYSDVKKVARPPVPERLPPLERKVAWDEVFSSVFKTVCWHCHSASDLARGDGGVGNTGGFGFPAKGLDVSSYEAIRSGSLGPDGKRRSVFIKDESGTTLLVRHMLARQRELGGDKDAELLGMPLGFPPMSAEQIQLVETWIAQGRPR